MSGLNIAQTAAISGGRRCARAGEADMVPDGRNTDTLRALAPGPAFDDGLLPYGIRLPGPRLQPPAVAQNPPPIRSRWSVASPRSANMSATKPRSGPSACRRSPAAASRREIVPFDRSGIRGQEMLQLLRLGVVLLRQCPARPRRRRRARAERDRPAAAEPGHAGAAADHRALAAAARGHAAGALRPRAASGLHLSAAGRVLPGSLQRAVRPGRPPHPHFLGWPVGTGHGARRHPGGHPLRRDRRRDA